MMKSKIVYKNIINKYKYMTKLEDEMELTYCWIDKFNNNLEDIEIDFGGEYRLKYDKHIKKLIISRNKDFIDGFFSNCENHKISNITGIIGKNGSGKSSILNFLQSIFIDEGIICVDRKGSYDFVKTILAIKEDNKLSIFMHDELVEDSKSIEIKDNIDIEIDTIFYGNKNLEDVENYEVIKTNPNNGEQLKIVRNSSLLKQITCIYMSNIFDMGVPDYNSDIQKGYYDISTNGILDELEKGLISIGDSIKNKPIFINEERGEVSNKFKISSVRRYKLYQMLQQINYITASCENYTYVQGNKFRLPNEIVISTDYSYKRSISNSIYIKDEELLRYEKDKHISKVEKEIYKRLDYNIEGCNDDLDIKKFITYRSFIKRIIDSYFNDLNRLIMFDKEYHNKLMENTEKILIDDLESITEISSLLDLIRNEILNIIDELKDNNRFFQKFKFKKELDQIIEIHEKYCRFIKLIENIIFKGNEFIDYQIFTVESAHKSGGTLSSGFDKEGNISIKLNEDTLKIINELINLYFELDSMQDFMIFLWRNISSGEYSLLDTYSKFYSLKNKDLRDNLFIIIDEGELYLHPEWQRQYISILIENLPKIYKDKNIQIIFASNSPFLISDLPRTNVVVLDKKDNKIIVSNNDVKRETFGTNISKLLDNSFFMDNTIGEFSKYKIEEIIKYLRGSSKSDKEKEYIKKVINIIDEPIIKKKLMQFYNEKYGEDIRDRIQYLNKSIEHLIKERDELTKNISNGDFDDKN